LAVTSSSTPMTSLSFMIRRSTLTILTSVTGPFAEQLLVADLEVDRDELAALVAAAADDLALLRLLLGGIGDNYAAGGLRLGINSICS
jgi:hypothetical protein